MVKKNYLSDLIYVESLPECKKYDYSDWEELREKLSDFIESLDEDGNEKRPIEDLYNYFMDTSDVSAKFATSAILFLLSAMTKKEQTIEYFQGSQNFNLWCMTFGQSSLMRKTSIEKKIKKLLKKIQSPLIDSIFTGPAIINVLEKTSKGSMIISEFSRMLKSFRNEHYSDIPEALCDIYDCSDEIVKWTRGKGRENVKNPYVTVWTSTTPRSYELLTEELFTQGFLMRFLYTNELVKYKLEPISFTAKMTNLTYDNVEELLLAIKTTRITEIRPSSMTKEFSTYQNYCDTISMQAQHDVYSILYSYYGRVPEFVLKIAGILELARYSFLGLHPLNDKDGTAYIGLTKDTLDLAVLIVKMYEEEFRMVVRKSKTKAESEPVRTNEKEILMIVDYIAGSPIQILSFPELIKSRIPRRKLEESLDTMVESEEIQCYEPIASPSGKGRPTRIYWLTDSSFTEQDAIKKYKKEHNL